MNAIRQELFDAVVRGRDKLAFVTDVRQEDGLLRIVLTVDKPAFHNRKAIDRWMFDRVLDAHVKMPDEALHLPVFRGVNQPSLERALHTGIDVQPSDAHWYGSDLEKALEYGGDYPAVLIIDGASITRPFRDVAVDAPEADHAAARAWAAGEAITSPNGKWLQYSRLPADDPKRGSPYEAAYAWYITGDPKAALIGVIECRSGGL